MKHVAILGAGVIGVACAHYLRRAGYEVTLIDKGRLGGACSHGNCGYVCPSHVLPHAGPGAVKMVLRTLFQRNSPLSVKPRLDWNLFDWMLRFARKCDHTSMIRAGQALHRLLGASRRLYDELLADFDADWQTQGLLFVFHTKQAFDHYHEVDALMRREFGVGATPYPTGELQQLEPALRAEVAGAYHYPCDAQLRPDRLLSEWKKRLLADGVTIRENVLFTGFARSASRLVAARTEQGDIPADAFVVATGAWTPLLADELRVRIPIQPGKGYSVTMPRSASTQGVDTPRSPNPIPRFPLIFEEHRVAVSPFADGYRIGSTMQFNGYDESTDPARVQLLLDSARLYLHDPCKGPIEETWWGWRPMVPDGVPVIGPAGPNLWLATGHGMLGLSLATGTGRLVAEMIAGVATHVDPTPYRVQRFTT
ncbi:MAG: FAD-dependent oxidoreductase [Planctomycetia bacterium]|nr:FAD-dependent oxidoreductase [Planctomycetia bacterium]